MQRKLTVILSADVVGYSSLMERDEAGTLGRLKVNRSAIFDPRVAAHGGRIVKLMGDGALVEFGSVVSAVECAREIQQATHAQPGAPEAERVRYRSGPRRGHRRR
jgi:class 3 adenylate cyclase